MKKTESPQSFADLGLAPRLLKVLDSIGFSAPTPIQAALIPVALTGRDCIGQARTGTGKTGSFVLPIIQGFRPEQKSIQALILCPTRELSEQVDSEFQLLAGNSEVETTLLIGGRPTGPQMKSLQRGCDVAIGTPGRVIDMIQRGVLKLNEVRMVVLDEADRMLDIGFRKDIERILRACSTDRQTLLLSATLDEEIERLAQRYMREPTRIDLSEKSIVVETIQQYYCTVEEEKKFQLLIKVLFNERPAQALVFCRTKRSAQKLYERLSRRLPEVMTIHGDLPQKQREKVIKRLREGQSRLVIATDIVGRGIDISGISHIVNYDIPQSCDDYIHRVGRTGRMSSNSDGRAITFVTPAQGVELTRIEMRINILLEEYVLGTFSGFESKVKRVVDKNEFFETRPTEDHEWDSIFAELG